MAGRGYKTEAVVLRSIRFGEADRVLHLYTLERGRVGAVAKGVRRTKSRFGARLEPLSHVELMLHQGGGELATVTGASLVRPHSEAREDSYRLSVGLVGLEAMLRLFTEQERSPKAFEALTRFLDVLDDGRGARGGAAARPARALVPAEAALALRLPAASDELRRVRVGGAARRLLAAGRRRRLRALRLRLVAALGRGDPRDRGSPRNPTRRCGDLEAGRARGATSDHVVVRVPRRLPPAHVAARA